MNRVIKVLLSVLVITTCMFVGMSAVFSADIPYIVYSSAGRSVTATATVTADGENKILVVCSYKNGSLQEIKTDKQYVEGTVTLSASVTNGVDEVVANVIDVFGGKAASAPAVYGADTISLSGIKVNGEYLSDYSDDVDEYTFYCESGIVDIDVVPVDSTSKVTVSGNTSPGNTTIDIVSSRGRKRTVTLNMYSDEVQTSQLSGIKYLIGEDEYTVPNFIPSTKKYSVPLPRNTMSVKLVPETVGDAKVYVTDTVVETVNGVDIGRLVDVAASAYPFKRNAVNNIIPIKNEIATAEIVVSNGVKENIYTVEFTAVQPRLTEFNVTGGAEDSIKPAFIGGSAVNNDNGTMVLTDRGWAVGNISDALLGGSCFMFVQKNKVSEKAQWWADNTSGEYFNFKADTPGKICIISVNQFTNSEYSENGWTAFKESSPSKPNGHPVWRRTQKDWNEYSNQYFMSLVQYDSEYATTKRAQNPGIAETDEFDGLTEIELLAGAYKTFEANETVRIYHNGRTGGNDHIMLAVIKWDDESIKYAPTEEDDGSAGGDEELIPELPSLDYADPNMILDVRFDENTDTTANVWNDESGNGNNITLITDGTNGGWSENGYFLKVGGNKIILPEAVTNALNTNTCTIQLELSDVSIADGCDNVGIISNADNLFMYTNATRAQLIWATGGASRPRVANNKLVGQKHTIVIDKNDDSATYGTIKWYVGSELVDQRNMNSKTKTTSNLALGTDNAEYAGSVTFKSLTFYNKVLTEQEITGGGAQ